MEENSKWSDFLLLTVKVLALFSFHLTLSDPFVLRSNNVKLVSSVTFSTACLSYFKPVKLTDSFTPFYGSELYVSLYNASASLCLFVQLAPWATSSRSPALCPAPCVPLTAGPARKDPTCASVAAASTGQPTMPTLLPAQVSFVCLFIPGSLGGVQGASLVICHLVRL